MIETLRHIDYRLFHFINQTMTCSFLDFICVVARDKKFLIFYYCVISYRLYKLYPEQFFKIAVAGALTFLLTDQLSAHLIKSIVHRLRPCNNPAIDVRLLIAHCGNGFSFVSAHAANTFGIAAFLSSVRNWRWQTVLILGTWASLVSFSQVYVGVHFPADVIGGALLGIVIGGSTSYVLKTKFDLQSTNQ